MSTASTSRPEPVRIPLSRDRIARAALALIDARGLAACTMRALGAELGVEAMSLYRHVPGKGGVLDAVVDLMLAEVDGPASVATVPTGGWRAQLGGFARRFRALALAHPHAFPLVASRPVAAYAAGSEMRAAGHAALMAAGFDAVTATDALRSVVRYVIGFSLGEAAAGAELARVEQILGVPADRPREELFVFGLELMLDGLEGRVRRRPR